MKIGLIDVDGHNFPNLALMKYQHTSKCAGIPSGDLAFGVIGTAMMQFGCSVDEMVESIRKASAVMTLKAQSEEHLKYAAACRDAQTRDPELWQNGYPGEFVTNDRTEYVEFCGAVKKKQEYCTHCAAPVNPYRETCEYCDCYY